MQHAVDLMAPITARSFEVGTFRCEVHGDFEGKAVRFGDTVREPMCPRCMADGNLRELEEVNRQREASRLKTLAELLGHSGIPQRYIQRGFDTYQAVTADQERALNVAKEYAVKFGDMRKSGEGLTLIGTPGTGKTHLATSICKAVIRGGGTAFFTTLLELVQVVTETWGKSEVSTRMAMNLFVEPDVLAVDEVGVQHKSRTEQTYLTHIINKRYEQMKPTILLSNLPPKSSSGDDLHTVLGERVISRLREVNQVLVMDWEDYRAKTN